MNWNQATDLPIGTHVSIRENGQLNGKHGEIVQLLPAGGKVKVWVFGLKHGAPYYAFRPENLEVV